MADITASEEELVAIFVHPDEYARNVNRVASVSTHSILFVKRKELAMTPFELQRFPLAECSGIVYQERFAIVPMIFGALLLGLVLLILTSEIPAGTSVPVGAMAALAVAATGWFFRPRRHLITFVFGDRRLRWQSKAGDFKYKAVSVQRLMAFAKERGLLRAKL
jgi:hypothetical protein